MNVANGKPFSQKSNLYCTSENSHVIFTYEYEKTLIFDKLLSREFMVRRNATI